MLQCQTSQVMILKSKSPQSDIRCLMTQKPSCQHLCTHTYFTVWTSIPERPLSSQLPSYWKHCSTRIWAQFKCYFGLQTLSTSRAHHASAPSVVERYFSISVLNCSTGSPPRVTPASLNSSTKCSLHGGHTGEPTALWTVWTLSPSWRQIYCSTVGSDWPNLTQGVPNKVTTECTGHHSHFATKFI